MHTIKIEEPCRFGALDLTVLKAFEKDNGIKLPKDYKAFLIANNGGRPVFEGKKKEKSVDWFYGFHDGPSWATIYHAIEVYQRRIPSWYFPIARDPFGNQYLMSLYEGNYGLVTFWNHEGETRGDASQYFDNMEAVTNSFSDFVEQCV